jgi:heptaprenyl diphosphate synthase
MSGFWDGHPALSKDLGAIRETILARADSDDPEVQGAIRQLLAAGGKMLRPAFVLLASRFGSPAHDRIIRVGAAVEMLHLATLVHDDIIDGASLRRGAATMHALRGSRIAVLVGDWLFASCFSLIADLAEMESARELSQIVSRICGSEISQSADRFAATTSVRRYLRRIAGKTAALFSLSFYVGARESGCPETISALLRRIGYCLGMGFQIVDDILDFTDGSAQTGKPSGSDLSQGIYTLPVILGLRQDDGRLRSRLARRPRGRRALQASARLIGERGGLDGARAAARRYTERSLREISRLPEGDARLTLAAVAEQLLHRRF